MKFSILCSLFVIVGFSSFGQGIYTTIGGGSGVFTTNFDGTLTTNTAYAGKFIATGGGTNLFDATVITNGANIDALTTATAYVPTNTASFINTNFGVCLVSTVYSNVNQRAVLSGTMFLQSAATIDAHADLYYTNNGLPHKIMFQEGKITGVGAAMIPFFVPLAPNATFAIQTNAGVGVIIYPTNVTVWKL